MIHIGASLWCGFSNPHLPPKADPVPDHPKETIAPPPAEGAVPDARVHDRIAKTWLAAPR